MRPIVLILLIGLPLAEIALFVLAGDAFGLWPTLAAVLGSALAGAFIIRRQGIAAVRRLQASATVVSVPAGAVLDGAAAVVAGILLIAPGFITDAVAILLLLPLTRRLLGRSASRYLRAHVPVVGAGSHPTIIDGEAVVVSESDRPPPPSLR